MKKTLLVMLALVMTIATIATAVSFVSAEDKTDAPAKYIVASLNPVTVDGTNTMTPATPHTAEADGTITTFGKTLTNEFIMDNKLENATIGAAWDLEKEKIYFAFSAEELTTAEITIGGEVFEVNFVDAEVEGGEVFTNEAGNFAEVALPIDFSLKQNATHIYADLEIKITAAEDSTFKGAVLFDKHAAGFAYNKIQKDGNAMLSNKGPANGQGSVVEEDRFLRVLDDDQAATGAMRTYALLTPGPNATKNITLEFDINIKAMPKIVPNAEDGPDKWGTISEARIWCAFMWIKGDVVYFDFYNTADQGIVVALYRQTAGFVSEKEMVIIPTGKQTGELFTFTMEWNEENTVGIYIDHVLVKEVENGGNSNPSLGKGSGTIQFNAQRKAAMGVGETIDAVYGNVSVNEVLYDYDEAALKDLSKTPIVTTTVETTTESETTTVAASETTTVAASETTTVTTTTAETTTVGTTAGTDATTTTAATTTEAEKGGCGSSLVAYGAVMVVGSALMAVVATSKKKED